MLVLERFVLWVCFGWIVAITAIQIRKGIARK